MNAALLIVIATIGGIVSPGCGVGVVKKDPKEELADVKRRSDNASALEDKDKWAEAEPEYRAIVAIQTRVLGADHPDTLSSRHKLALSLKVQKKFTEAEQEDREVLAIRKRVLGEEHPDTLKCRSNIAFVLQAQGKNIEAEKENREVLAIRERVLGPQNPETLISCYHLADCLAAQGKFSDALPFLQRADAGWPKSPGVDYIYAVPSKATRKRIEHPN